MADARDLLTRRHFVRGAGVASLGLLAGCGRWPWQAQPGPPRVPRVGWLSASAPPPINPGNAVESFIQGLQDFGYIDGRTVALEYRWAEGNEEQLPALATELVQLPVDIVVAAGAAPARAAKLVTSTIPIVIGASNDPVAAGLVDSLAHPGSNVTGLSLMAPQLTAKRVQLLKEAIPTISRVGVLASMIGGTVEQDWNETQAAARTLDLQVQRLEVSHPDALGEVFEIAAREGADGLVQLASQLLARERRRIVELALHHRLPAIYESRVFVTDGGLAAYGANVNALYRRAAYYVDRILKGTRPADLPVEQPREFDFVINLRTAQALGLTIPQHVLLQATEVLQ